MQRGNWRPLLSRYVRLIGTWVSTKRVYRWYRNAEARETVYLEYSLQALKDSLSSKPDNMTQREFLLKKFPPPFNEASDGQSPLIEKPTMIVDSAEKVALCFLPGLFTERPKVHLTSQFSGVQNFNNPPWSSPSTGNCLGDLSLRLRSRSAPHACRKVQLADRQDVLQGHVRMPYYAGCG